MSFQTVSPRRRRLDRGDAVFQHDVMRRLLESQSGHPATVHQRPRRPIVVTAMTQEKARELLTGLAQAADGRKTRAHEIADRLMSLIRNPDSGQFTGAMQLGEVDRISPVGLDPISRLARDQRRSHDDALMPGEGSTGVECHSRKVRPHSRTEARSRHATASPPEPSQPPACSRSCHTRAHHSARPPRRQRYRDRVLVHVKTDICDSFVQDPSPMHEARRRHARRNPR